jgi:hypothetical protein
MPGDGEKGKESFCPLLWISNGGQMTSDLKRLRLQFDYEGVDNRYHRGYCTTPSDCAGCIHMREEMAKHDSKKVFWLCPDCVSPVLKNHRAAGVPFVLPGYFTEGQCQNPSCPRPAPTGIGGHPMKDEEGNDLPPGWSRFLQLFIQG